VNVTVVTAKVFAYGLGQWFLARGWFYLPRA